MDTIIETCHLTKKFTPTKTLYDSLRSPFQIKEKILAVDDISFDINKQEIIAFVGSNESGKTTLFKILSCLILPTSGYAKVAGYNILSEAEKVKSSIGLVNGDERSFYWRLTLRQNIFFFASLYNLPRQVAVKKINYLSHLLEIGNRLNCRFQECSSGIKQRLAIARALLADPAILLMDEPFKSLDYITCKKLKHFIREVLVKEKKKTILFASHNLSNSEGFADRISVLHKGRLIINESANALINKYGRLAHFLEQVNKENNG